MNDSQRAKSSFMFFGILSIILFITIVAGLIFLATSNAGDTSVILAYVAGLSMIFLPCTFPLVFVIVPMTVGHNPRKGFIMAILFGLGLAITLTIYGILTAGIGSFLGVDKATRIMFTIAGIAALIFGLYELRLLQFKFPGLSGGIPQWVQDRRDYVRVFFMGLFLGNAGVGCPNPAFYVLLAYIASTGNFVTGGWLGFIHGLGRATPLIFLAILGIMGFNSVKWASGKRLMVDAIMGWGLIAVGAFIFGFGLFGMKWWENSYIHIGWNNFIMKFAPNLAELEGHDLIVPQGYVSGPSWSGWVLLAVIIFVIYLWYRIKLNKNLSKPPNNETK